MILLCNGWRLICEGGACCIRGEGLVMRGRGTYRMIKYGLLYEARGLMCEGGYFLNAVFIIGL